MHRVEQFLHKERIVLVSPLQPNLGRHACGPCLAVSRVEVCSECACVEPAHVQSGALCYHCEPQSLQVPCRRFRLPAVRIQSLDVDGTEYLVGIVVVEERAQAIVNRRDGCEERVVGVHFAVHEPEAHPLCNEGCVLGCHVQAKHAVFAV